MACLPWQRCSVPMLRNDSHWYHQAIRNSNHGYSLDDFMASLKTSSFVLLWVDMVWSSMFETSGDRCLLFSFVCLLDYAIDWSMSVMIRWVWRWRGRHDTSFVHCPASLYRNFFSKLDLNRDGKISFQEFRACLVCTGDGSWKWLWVQINEENARSIRFANHRFFVVWQLQKNLTQQRWVTCGIRVWHALMIFHVEFFKGWSLEPRVDPVLKIPFMISLAT